jgi:hypothetical protein
MERVTRELAEIHYRPNIVIANAMLKVCARDGDCAAANAIVGKVVDEWHLDADDVTWTTYIRTFIRAADLPGAVAIFNRLIEQQQPLSVFCVSKLAEACAREGLLKDAALQVVLCMNMHSGAVPGATVVKVLAACARADSEPAHALAEEALGALMEYLPSARIAVAVEEMDRLRRLIASRYKTKRLPEGLYTSLEAARAHLHSETDQERRIRTERERADRVAANTWKPPLVHSSDQAAAGQG